MILPGSIAPRTQETQRPAAPAPRGPVVGKPLSAADSCKPIWVFALVLATAAPASVPVPIRAQNLPGDTVSLAPIIVSALRSPVRLDRMPFSASVIAGPTLSEGNSGLFIEEALHALPGVRVQNRYNASTGERISIRGFGARSQFGVRGIRILVDGIPATLPDGQSTLDHLDIGSLGRVEVLRGPASALYGNGAGGVILFRSAPPYSGTYRQDLSVVAGSDGLLRVQTTGSGTVGQVGFRASAARTVFDGFRSNASGSGEDPYSRAERATITTALTSPAAAGTLTVRLSGLDLAALNPGSLPADVFDEGSSEAWGFNIARRTRKDVRQGQVGVHWRGPFTGLEWVVAAYWVRRELDNPIPTSVIDLRRSGGGARLQMGRAWERIGRPGRVDVGVEGDFQSDYRRNFVNDGGSAGALTLDQEERVYAAAVFCQLRMPLTGRLDAMAALRFDRFGFRVNDLLAAPDDPDDSGERGMGGLSPSFGVHFDLGDHGVFASAGRSFETPTTTELANRPDGAGGFNPDLAPQEGWTFEGGIRGVAGSRSAYDLAVFTTVLTGQLVPFEVLAAPGRRFYHNAGRSRVRGFEVSTRTVLSSLLAARLAYGYVDARFIEFRAGNRVFDENRVPGIAPHRLEASLRAGRGVWFGEIRLELRGEVPANDANDGVAEGYGLAGIRFGATDIRLGRFTLSPFAAVTNLTNARHASSVVVNAFGGRYFEPGPDRGGHMGLTVRWETVGDRS